MTLENTSENRDEFQFPFRQVIVIGGTGQAGSRLVELFRSRSDLRLLATSRTTRRDEKVTWDVLDLDGTKEDVLASLRAMQKHLVLGEPTALFLAAAYTNVEGCEQDPIRNERINVQNSIAVLDWGRRLGAHLTFFSTDYVFDGRSGPYSENDEINPLSKYGQGKAQVEKWLHDNVPQSSLVVRTTGVYDYQLGSKNFLMQMLEAWGQGRTTKITSDQKSNPVWAVELVKATVELVSMKESGIFHIAGGSVLFRDEFARLIAQIFGYDPALVLPIKTSQLQQKAARPLASGLYTKKLNGRLGWTPSEPETVLNLLKWTHKR